MPVSKLHNNYDQALEMNSLTVNDALSSGLSLSANYTLISGRLDVGPDSPALVISDGYTSPAAVFSISNPDNYAQIAFKNTASGANASTDFIAYADNGNDASGYIDMGITSSTFGDPAFTITGANDGYIFMGAPKPSHTITKADIANGIVTITTADEHGFSAGTTVRIETYAARLALQFGSYYSVTIVNVINAFQFALSPASSTLVSSDLANLADVYQPSGNGNLVIATDATGATNNIVFAAGGLATDTSQMTITETGYIYLTNGNIKTKDIAIASTPTSGLLLQTGDASGTASASGSVTIDTGTATGTKGSILIGTTNTPTITIGRTTGVTTTINGTTIPASATLLTSASSLAAANIAAGTLGSTVLSAAGTTTTAGQIGYMGMPQVTATTGNVTIAAQDAGKHIYSTATRTITIDSNANLALPVGTTITFIAATGATVTISITTDTLILAGTGTSTGSRTLAPFGMATAVKVATNTWFISGNGLT
jgi:hypothetical protein